MVALIFAPLSCAALLLLQQAAFRLYSRWRLATSRRRFESAFRSTALRQGDPEESLVCLAAILPGFATAVYCEEANSKFRLLHHTRKSGAVDARTMQGCCAFIENKAEVLKRIRALEAQDLGAAILEDAFAEEPVARFLTAARSLLWPWRAGRVGLYIVHIPEVGSAAGPGRRLRAVGFFDRFAYLPPGHLLEERMGSVFGAPEAPAVREHMNTDEPPRSIFQANDDARLSRVIHDVRLPLTRLFPMLENLKDRLRGRAADAGQDPDGDEEIERSFARIARQLRTMESFTYDVLNLESEGIIDDEREPTILNVAERVRQIVDAHLDLIQRKQITVLYDFPGDDPGPAILARSMAFDRIVFNLLTNSFQFCSSPGRIHLGLARRRDHVILDIEDSGPGLASQENAFELSRRNIGRGGSGWGIGLASARDLSRRLGGRLVTARPRHGKGARFLLVLPGIPVQSGTR